MLGLEPTFCMWKRFGGCFNDAKYRDLIPQEMSEPEPAVYSSQPASRDLAPGHAELFLW